MYTYIILWGGPARGGPSGARPGDGAAAYNRLDTHIYIYIYIYTHTYVYVYLSLSLSIYIYIYIHIINYKYIYIYIYRERDIILYDTILYYNMILSYIHTSNTMTMMMIICTSTTSDIRPKVNDSIRNRLIGNFNDRSTQTG